MTTETKTYPVNLKGEMAAMPSRWQWIFKWLLAIPHYIVLFFLGIAFCVIWVIAFFTILFTGKFPKSLFDFNAGVLRWSWRVGFYSYSALGTDKYPPFSLDPDPNYPADLAIPYPEKLSNGLVLVKWWLLAIPHWIIISIFQDLIPILVFVAGICMLFGGTYPKDLFKLIIGLNRWSYRVMAYVSLMTDEYPPFRLWDN
jgi:hypothetical protein